ncbi:MAG: lipocalin family protein [Porticoccaceae bacterium]|nr:lipocalin family protein [Porticoccaceae bacterium]|tara:strand:- start:11270 stop:11821 length:552 start_codon:yes stop_codon:yes gene_type:complete
MINNGLTSLLKRLFLVVVFVGLAGCLGVPEGVHPVQNFQLQRYLGQWYEIARLDHSFERGMSSVSATYSMREDGGVAVLNAGFTNDSQEWDEAEGKAYFVETPDVGHLKVSFFGPFYGSYIIFELDNVDYQYAFVAGMNTDYLWFLSRSPEVSDELINHFVELSATLGFDTENLIFVDHNKHQ